LTSQFEAYAGQNQTHKPHTQSLASSSPALLLQGGDLAVFALQLGLQARDVAVLALNLKTTHAHTQRAR